MTSDVGIYGGTSAGVIAAVAAAKAGKTVLLIEPGRHLGGMTSGGLGQTDFGKKSAIGGLSREFYRRLGKIYGMGEAWTFEPHRAQQVMRELIAEARVTLLSEHRVAEVNLIGGKIDRVLLEHSPTDAANAPVRDFREHVIVQAFVWIDASYEGDLMARAKVGCMVGRERVSQYQESLNGIRALTPHHQFSGTVDPWVTPGKPDSGLLPLIQPGDGGRPGDGDTRVQAYNFRLCLTSNPANALPISPPLEYDPKRFEILSRHVEAMHEAGKNPTVASMLKIDAMPNFKTDINNNGAVSTDYVGGSWLWPQADYGTRGAIWHEHLAYTQGLLHFMATDPRLPADVREQVGRYGLCRDEFADTGGWPHQLYVREARCMIGRYVVTQADCEHHTEITDSIALASYNMDSHNCQRVVQDGVVRNEGNVQAPPAGPFPISYRAITPKTGECENLLVPVCLSASHIAFGSIRMEPVFMVLAESAATAGCLAIDKRCSVQDVNTQMLMSRLENANQILRHREKDERDRCITRIAACHRHRLT